MKSLIALLKSGAQAEHVERVQHPRGLLTIWVSRSKVQRRIETFALIACAAVLALAQISIWITALGWLALAGYAVLRAQTAKNPYLEIRLLPDDRLELRRENALETVAAQISGRLFVSPAAVAFWIVGEQPGAIVLTPDQIPAAQFRALRVRLKYLREPSEMVNPR
jgi:hypothetical protein